MGPDRRLVSVVVVLLALAVVPARSPAQGISGGLLDQQRAGGISLLTVVAPPSETQPAPKPGNEKFLCWNIWYAHTSGHEWVMLTDAPDTADGQVFVQEAIKAITSAPTGAHWTVRRFPDKKALEAESDKVGARLDAASKPDPGTLAKLRAFALSFFKRKK